MTSQTRYTRSSIDPKRYTSLVKLFVQFPDGKTATRKTDRVYTHVVASFALRGWVVIHWCGSEHLAAQQARRYNDVKIIPVVESDPLKGLTPAKTSAATVTSFTQPAPAVIVEPEPNPVRGFKVVKHGRHEFYLIIQRNGLTVGSHHYTKELPARAAILRAIRGGYKLVADEAGIVSPLSTYRG